MLIQNLSWERTALCGNKKSLNKELYWALFPLSQSLSLSLSHTTSLSQRLFQSHAGTLKHALNPTLTPIFLSLPFAPPLSLSHTHGPFSLLHMHICWCPHKCSHKHALVHTRTHMHTHTRTHSHTFSSSTSIVEDLELKLVAKCSHGVTCLKKCLITFQALKGLFEAWLRFCAKKEKALWLIRKCSQPCLTKKDARWLAMTSTRLPASSFFSTRQALNQCIDETVKHIRLFLSGFCTKVQFGLAWQSNFSLCLTTFADWIIISLD